MKKESNSTTKKEDPEEVQRSLEQLIIDIKKKRPKFRKFSKEQREFFIREALEEYDS